MKLLNKLTLKNLRLNKVRTIVTIVGIMLSAALIHHGSFGNGTQRTTDYD